MGDDKVGLVALRGRANRWSITDIDNGPRPETSDLDVQLHEGDAVLSKVHTGVQFL